jgi:hypothetical protein
MAAALTLYRDDYGPVLWADTTNSQAPTLQKYECPRQNLARWSHLFFAAFCFFGLLVTTLLCRIGR